MHCLCDNKVWILYLDKVKFWIRIQIPESIETSARNISLLNPSKGEHTVYRNNILTIFTINGVLRNASYIILYKKWKCFYKYRLLIKKALVESLALLSILKYWGQNRPQAAVLFRVKMQRKRYGATMWQSGGHSFLDFPIVQGKLLVQQDLTTSLTHSCPHARSSQIQSLHP